MDDIGGSNSVGGSGPSANSSRSKTVRKNATGSRNDIAWTHGYPVDDSPRKVKCKYCQKVISGGAYRFKHHLAGTGKDVCPCIQVPPEIKEEMLNIVSGLQDFLISKSKKFLGNDEVESQKRKESGSSFVNNIFKKRGVNSQSTLNQHFKKKLHEEADEDVADFFYTNAIPFNVANSEAFHKMLESVAKHGPGYKPPSYYDIRVKHLKKKVEKTKEIIEEHRAYWKKTGCTIMTDGWTDRKRRTIINFLVHSPKGIVFLKSIDASSICKTAEAILKMLDDIIDEVGEENIVQVVTDNAANYKAAGALLMNKRSRIYWTPCAAHCIDLMLEDFGKKLKIHKDTIENGRKITTYIYSKASLISILQSFTKGKELIRPAITRFATSYLTLGSLLDNMGPLKRMFVSKEWSSSRFAKEKDGKLVEDYCLDSGFWKNVATCLRGAYPLIRVLRMVDSDAQPAMGFIYDAMDRAKEEIQKDLFNVKKSYMPIWTIIDDRWDKQLHRPLHAAGYYLNPYTHYAPDFEADVEVMRGFYECMERMLSREVRITANKQLEFFKSRSACFGMLVAIEAIEEKTKTPGQWWESFGYEFPDIQRFAIRVLSLTCSSSGCERNWSVFERVHTKKRNRLLQKTMNDVVFVMTNTQLSNAKKPRKSENLSVMENLPSDDDWIVNVGDGNEEDNDDIDFDMARPSDDEVVQIEDEVTPSTDDLVVPDDIVGDVDEDNEDVEENENDDRDGSEDNLFDYRLDLN